MGETGVATIGMAALGAVVAGMAAIGTTGTAIGITVTIAWSSLAISAFQDGGAGAGDTPMDTATAIRTVTTGMAIRTVTAMAGTDMVTTATGTAMDMATVLTASTVLAASTAPAVNTAPPLIREWPSYNDGSPGPVIIAGQLMGAWDLRRGERIELTGRGAVR